MGSTSGNYHAYLLRCWRDGAESSWRATLEDPHSGQILAFASTERLFAFLRQQLEEDPPRPEQPQKGR